MSNVSFELPMTPRHIEVVVLIAQGKSNKEIARALGISVHTAADHVREVLSRLNVQHRVQAGVWAAKQGLV